MDIKQAFTILEQRYSGVLVRGESPVPPSLLKDNDKKRKETQKKMKRINTTKLLVLLLSLCLITSSFVGGTLAKYVTTSEAADTARVAKWGIALQVDGSLYGVNYETGTASVPSTENDTTKLSVATSNTSEKILAPGTKSDSGLHVSLTGKPEVSYKTNATISYENIYLTNGSYGLLVKAPTVTATSYKANTYYYEDSGKYVLDTTAVFTANHTYYTMEDVAAITATETNGAYYPVVYNWDGATDKTGDYKADSLKAIADVIGPKFGTIQGTAATTDGKTTVTYESTQKAPNTDIATDLLLSDEKLTWAWAFENVSPVSPEIASWSDKADTILGHLMAGLTVTTGDAFVVKGDDTNGWTVPTAANGANVNDYNLETCFELKVTVTQID